MFIAFVAGRTGLFDVCHAPFHCNEIPDLSGRICRFVDKSTSSETQGQIVGRRETGASGNDRGGGGDGEKRRRGEKSPWEQIG